MAGVVFGLAGGIAGCRDSVAPSSAGPVIRIVVEIPAGSRDKMEYRDGAFVLDRVIPEDVGGYPVNYGFVPCTRAPDGDPLDVLVPGPPRSTGDELRVRVVGTMRMRDEKGTDPKILGVASGNEAWTEALRREVADFFEWYKQHEPTAHARVLGWAGAAEARKLLEASRRTECSTR